MSNVLYATLSELAKELRINKSKLAYFFSLGLLEPVEKIGGMNVFDKKKTLATLKKIDKLKVKNKTLEQIKAELQS